MSPRTSSYRVNESFREKFNFFIVIVQDFDNLKIKCPVIKPEPNNDIGIIGPSRINPFEKRKELVFTDKGVPQNRSADGIVVIGIEQTEDASAGTHEPEVAINTSDWGFEGFTHRKGVVGVEGEVGFSVIGGLEVGEVVARGGGGGGEVEFEEVGVGDQGIERFGNAFELN